MSAQQSEAFDNYEHFTVPGLDVLHGNGDVAFRDGRQLLESGQDDNGGCIVALSLQL